MEEPASPVEDQSFGKYVQSVRLSKGLSIDQVATATRIRVETLDWIESEQMERLPSAVYVRGFLRSVCKFMDADGDRAVALFDASLTRYEGGRRKRRKRPFPQEESRGMRMPFLVMVVLLGAGGAIFWRFSLGDTIRRLVRADSRPAAASSEPVDALSKIMEPESDTTVSNSPPKADLSLSKPLLLNIHATKETWLKVIIDDRPPVEYQLKSGDRLALEALERHNLLIGNAAAVELAVNGKPYPVEGKAGQTIALQIP